MDDTLFLKAALQIASNAFDPYGFTVNWYLTEMPMADVMKNPPLLSYYIALIASFFGWSEAVLHFALLPFAIAAVIGIYYLARLCSSPPLLASAIFLVSPYFLVSSCNIMCDTMMLSFFIWSIVLWIDGLQRYSCLKLLSSCCILTLAVLTKYFALSAVPLMIVYALMHHKKLSMSLFTLALPMISLVIYQQFTASIYGHGLLSDAVEYANLNRWVTGSTAWGKILVGLGFVGAVLPFIFLLAPRLLPSYISVGYAVFSIVSSLLVLWQIVPTGSPTVSALHKPILAIELAIFIFMGLMVITMVLTSPKAEINPETTLLMLWVAGTFIFGCMINWTINARTLLPLGPPAAILFSKRLALHGKPTRRLIAASFIVAAFLSLSVCWSDYRLAESGRTASKRLLAMFSENETIWFQGHWGFQYYMEKGKAKPIDVQKSHILPGDIIIVPNNNTNVFRINPGMVEHVGFIEIPSSHWVTTRAYNLGAGFYSHVQGPLPFAFIPVPTERYDIFRSR